MKKFIVSLVLSVLIIGCSDSSNETINVEKIEVQSNTEVEPTNVIENKNFTDIQKQAISDYFISNEEPTVIDALWTMDTMFKIGVSDDGTDNRDGLAQYACTQINSEFGGNGKKITVQVIDYQTLMQTKEWIKLGEANC